MRPLASYCQIMGIKKWSLGPRVRTRLLPSEIVSFRFSRKVSSREQAWSMYKDYPHTLYGDRCVRRSMIDSLLAEDHGNIILIWKRYQRQSSQDWGLDDGTKKKLGQWFIWIVKTCVLTPLRGWCYWLVQDSRQRGTIWIFEIVAALFVIMEAYNLNVET